MGKLASVSWDTPWGPFKISAGTIIAQWSFGKSQFPSRFNDAPLHNNQQSGYEIYPCPFYLPGRLPHLTPPKHFPFHPLSPPRKTQENIPPAYGIFFQKLNADKYKVNAYSIYEAWKDHILSAAIPIKDWVQDYAADL
jgi:hypothetical protein